MPQPWYHAVLEYAFLAAYYLLMGLGPPAYLLWAWRRSGDRRRLAVHAALLPVGLFALAGGVGAALTLIEVLRSPPTRTTFSRMGPAEYVAYSYWSLGAWSVWSAALFALAWVPAVLAWRRLHPASFRRATTPTSRRALSFAERDYGERVITDSGAASDGDGRRLDPSVDDVAPAAPVRTAPGTDYLLWLVLAGIPNLAFVGLRFVQSEGSELIDEYTHVTSWAVLVVVASVILGWAAQEVAVRCGFRLSGRRWPDQSADYDEQRPVEPGAAARPRRPSDSAE
jgi:hypothetical protein